MGEGEGKLTFNYFVHVCCSHLSSSWCEVHTVVVLYLGESFFVSLGYPPPQAVYLAHIVIDVKTPTCKLCGRDSGQIDYMGDIEGREKDASRYSRENLIECRQIVIYCG